MSDVHLLGEDVSCEKGGIGRQWSGTAPTLQSPGLAPHMCPTPATLPPAQLLHHLEISRSAPSGKQWKHSVKSWKTFVEYLAFTSPSKP